LLQNSEGFFKRVQDVYRACAPSLMSAAADIDRYEAEPANNPLFCDPLVRSYQWTKEYSAPEYIDLLGTYSDHISLPDSERRDLFSGIADLIRGNTAGGC